MCQMLAVTLLAALLGQESPHGKTGAQLLIDTIESVQHPLEDFRCEYEGTIRRTREFSRTEKLGPDGLADSFGGTFVWKRGGDTRCDTLHRAADGSISRDLLVVRMQEQQAEQYHRLNDSTLGRAVIQSPKEVNSWQTGSLGEIFLIDKLKRIVADEDLESSVYDDTIEGRALKVLNVTLRGLPNSLIFRFWIDLQRNGHVVRQETYAPGAVMNGRFDIKLRPFRVGKDDVFMPVYGFDAIYVAIEDKKPVTTKEPTVLKTIYILENTMEFNNRPGPEAFTIKYKPGTPISDHVRKMTTEFGQQKLPSRPTKAAVEKMLNDQIAKADDQKSELVVASPTEGFDWSSWFIWGMGAAVLLSSAALWLQHRRH